MADALPAHRFAMTRAEERWIVSGGEPRLTELRAEAGFSSTSATSGAIRTDARSDRWFPNAEAFGGEPDRLFADLLDRLPPSRTFLVRRVVESRAAGADPLPSPRTTRLISVRAQEGGGFLVPLDFSSVEFIADRADLLVPDPEAFLADFSSLPIAWLHGTGSVLLHEAAGHPAEIGAEPARWPPWLRIRDDPDAGGIGDMKRDDSGREVATRDLTRGELPDAWRRESYRDVPLRRMTNLIVESEQVLPALPSPRLEALLLGGGDWDPLSDQIRVRVLEARLVQEGSVRRILPFVYRVSRRQLSRLLLGSFGESVWYPGVLCGDEGQRVPVGSRAPMLVTGPVGA